MLLSVSSYNCMCLTREGLASKLQQRGQVGHCTGAPCLSQWRSGREEREDGGEIGGEMGRRGER